MTRRISACCGLAAILGLAAGCGSPDAPAREPTSVATTPDPGPVLADDCPPADSEADRAIAAGSAAIVPLKPGLTLSTVWHRATEGDEVECLTQIQGIDSKAIAATANCSLSTGTQGGSRHTCRTDMSDAYMYYTGAGDESVVLRGATMFSLSTRAFSELKSRGSTRHRFVTVLDGAIAGDLDGTLQRDSTGTLTVIVNDRPVELPVVRASGTLRGEAMGKPLETRVSAAIVDDGRFPLVLDYALPDVGSAGFSVRYGKVSFPTDGKLEHRLAEEQRIDIYGIYFDVDSHRLRPESDPVLREIADALGRNPRWRVEIGGHTDSTGSAQRNLELSRLRSESVRDALVGRYGVAAGRLSAHGYGATMPVDANDTPEGRARNRRVELVRREGPSQTEDRAATAATPES